MPSVYEHRLETSEHLAEAIVHDPDQATGIRVRDPAGIWHRYRD